MLDALERDGDAQKQAGRDAPRLARALPAEVVRARPVLTVGLVP